MQTLLKMQMQILMYDANILKDVNASLNSMMQMILKVQMQVSNVMQMILNMQMPILIYDTNALKDANANFNVLCKCS